jgi:Lar family restriction alleviation protein
MKDDRVPAEGYKLKPCPFCGGKAIYVTVQAGPSKEGSYLFYNLRCKSCNAHPPGAYGGIFTTMKENGKVQIEKLGEKEAVEAWNRRAADV